MSETNGYNEPTQEEIIKAIRHVFKKGYLIQKTVANGNKFCGLLYVPKRFRKKQAIVIILDDENS